MVAMAAATGFDHESLAPSLAQLAGVLPKVILLPLWNPALNEHKVGILDRQINLQCSYLFTSNTYLVPVPLNVECPQRLDGKVLARHAGIHRSR